MDNQNYWPYTNIHELNLDWIISKVKELDTRFTSDIETFVRDYIDEHFAEWTVNANYDPDDETIIYTNGTGATLTAGDVIRFAIDNAFVNVKDPTARTAASAAQTTANNAGTAAAAAQTTADSAVTAAAAAQSTADTNTTAIAALDTKIEEHIPYLWTLFNDTIPTTATTLSAVPNRKISDFQMIIAQWERSNFIRETSTVYRQQLIDGFKISMTNIDASNIYRYVEITYVDDTHISIVGSSSITTADYIRIFGVGSVHTE